MFCSKCGNQLNEGVKFCKKCGAPVVSENVKAPVTFAVPPPFGTPPPLMTPPPAPPFGAPPPASPFLGTVSSMKTMTPAIPPPPIVVPPFGTPAPMPPVGASPSVTPAETPTTPVMPAETNLTEPTKPKTKALLWIVGGCIAVLAIALGAGYYVLKNSNLFGGNNIDEAKKIVHSTEPEMVYVQGGTFTMGCTSEQSDCHARERPAHRVTVSSFSIGKYEITQGQWVKVMGSNPSSFKGDNHPVETVSWNDIVGTSGNSMFLNGIRYYENGFIYKLNRATGKSYRLPTEAEWEYAARGGSRSRGYKYSGSNNMYEVAWHEDNSGGTSRQVGTKQPNELGIYDMSGNVWEWVSNLWESYSANSETNPQGPYSGTNRVRRGGGWPSEAQFNRVSYRITDKPDICRDAIGFRVVLQELDNKN